MSVIITPAPPVYTPPLPPIVWDVSMDYNEVEGRFYARSDIDHKVCLSDNQRILVNPSTGEVKGSNEIV